MISKISLLAAFAALPLVLTGCGGDSASTTSSQNTAGQDVKFGENSQDLGSAPYYFEGTRIITGFDGTFNALSSPASTPSTTTKALAKVTLTLTGELIGEQNGHPAGYMLTISFLNTNGATPVDPVAPPYTNATVYKVGFAKDVFNDVYCFAPSLPGPVNKVGATSVDVFINSQVATIAGPIKDFTVNIPTAVGTALAPYTGTINATALTLVKLVVDNGTLANGGTTQASTAATTSAKFDVAIPWLSPIKAPVITEVVPATMPPTVLTITPQVDQTAYWKAGYGLVECTCRYNWVIPVAQTEPAPGTSPLKPVVTVPATPNGQAADYSINPLVLNSIDTTLYKNFGPIVTGFVNPEVAPIPRGVN